MKRAKEAGIKAIPTGIDHGTVTLVCGGEQFEVTTFRRDVQTDGRRAVVAYSDDLVEDASRRDFTMNALYADASGEIIDPLGGTEDLKRRLVRFINDPDARIKEDTLRILRFFRFNAFYGAPDAGFDAAGLAACAEHGAGIDSLSRERVGAEMMKLLSAPDPSRALGAMEKSGVLQHVISGAATKYVFLLQHVEVEISPVARLAMLCGSDALPDLRLSNAQARLFSTLRKQMQDVTPAHEIAYRETAQVARLVLGCRAALAEQSIAPAALDGLARAAEQVFPVRAADLPQRYEGKAIGDALKALEARWIANEHAKTCGGCALQHASDDFMREWKAQQVATALSNRGIDSRVSAVHVSPARSRRRAALHGRRTKSGTQVGFYARGGDQIVPITECHLLTDAITDALPLIQDIVQIVASRREAIDLTVTEMIGGLDIAISSARDLDLEPREKLIARIANASVVRLSWNNDLLFRRDGDHLALGGVSISPPAGCFLQATREGEAALIHSMQTAVAGAKRVVDLFSGCGTFALPLSESAEVLAVEFGADMLEALDQAVRKSSGRKPLRTEVRDLFRRPLLAAELNAFDAIVIDPPRAGAQAQIEEIVKSDVKLIGFVSCNSVTFARDCARLIEAGYRIDNLEVIDQFRWSPHIEIAAALSRD